MGKLLELIVGFFGASWRTTILGWVGIITGLGMLLSASGVFLKAAFDNDPATVPDWETISIAWVALLGGVKGLMTRDNAVSSDAAKAAGTNVK